LKIRADPDIICEAMRSSSGRALQFASDELRSDREFVAGAAQEIGAEVLAYAAEDLRADREFVTEVADYCPPGELLKYVSSDLRVQLLADQEFVLEAVQQIGLEVLEDASLELRGDRDFMMMIFDSFPSGEALPYATDELRMQLFSDHTYMLRAVREIGPEVLQNASQDLRGSRDFMLEATRCCPPGEVLQFATDELRAELFSDRSFVLQAVKDIGSEVLEFTSQELRADRDFMLAAACFCAPGEAMRFAASELCAELNSFSAGAPQVGEEVSVDTFASALHASPSDNTNPPILLCPKEPDEYVQPSVNHQLSSEFAVSSGEEVVNNTLQPSVDPAAVLQSVKATGVQALASAPAELRGDREFMLSVAVCFPLAEVMPFVTDELRVQLCADRCFMLRAIQEVGSGILAEASLELRGDREFMLAAASCCEPRLALKYASDKLLLELCADRSFMLKAVQQVGTAVLAHASADLRADQEFIMSAATWRPAAEVLKYASKKLREELSLNRDFMLKIVQQAGPAHLANISVKLRGDKDFMLSIAMVFPQGGVLRHATKELRAELYADRTFVVKAVHYSGLPELLHASLDLRRDREFMLAFAAHYPLAEVLHYTTDQLRAELYGDHFFMLRLLEEIGATELERASEELRGNRDFMLAAEACCPLQEVLRCCTSELRNVLCGDRVFILKAVKEAGAGMLENATSELRADLGFMMQVSGYCPAGEALRYVSEELRAELDDE